jgi:hypothetical protein
LGDKLRNAAPANAFHDLIVVLLGKQSIAVIPIFKILCGVGLLQSVTATTGWVYQSQGRNCSMVFGAQGLVHLDEAPKGVEPPSTTTTSICHQV